MMENKDNQRAKEFLQCLGNGKSIYQCEDENDSIDELWKENVLKDLEEGKKE